MREEREREMLVEDGEPSSFASLVLFVRSSSLSLPRQWQMHPLLPDPPLSSVEVSHLREALSQQNKNHNISRCSLFPRLASIGAARRSAALCSDRMAWGKAREEAGLTLWLRLHFLFD